MSKYSTGELAKLCEVSVRTVQFYDSKDLLKPSEISEGGRRLYSEKDLALLRQICFLKSLGLALDAIKGILTSDEPGKVLLVLLDEQERCIAGEMAEKRRQLSTIEEMRRAIRDCEAIPVQSIADMERMMKDRKKLRKTHGKILVLGILMDIVEVCTLILWIEKGIWLPFAVGMLLVIFLGIAAVKMYHRDVVYICPECGAKFQPPLRAFFSSRHTPRTRNLVCSSCGHRGWCVETAASVNEG